MECYAAYGSCGKVASAFACGVAAYLAFYERCIVALPSKVGCRECSRKLTYFDLVVTKRRMQQILERRRLEREKRQRERTQRDPYNDFALDCLEISKLEAGRLDLEGCRMS